MEETGVILNKCQKMNIRGEIFIFTTFFFALYAFCTFHNFISYRVVRKRCGVVLQIHVCFEHQGDVIPMAKNKNYFAEK